MLKANWKTVKASKASLSASEQIRLAKSVGWEAANKLVDKGVVSFAVYDHLRRDRVWEGLVLDKCYHWHSTIQDSRMALAGFREVKPQVWKHRHPSI